MKLWEKGNPTNEFILSFTTGKDRQMDLYLAPYDILGSIAHAKMLGKVGLLKKDEVNKIHKELVGMYKNLELGNFTISSGCEDIHSEIEKQLTEQLGETGKKIHTGRSRNDQVLVDIRLFTRNKLLRIAEQIRSLFDLLSGMSEEHKNLMLPGYTHLQAAMPSSFGLWFGAYAEALADDLELLYTTYRLNNRNPLGSAAGYGTSFPINRTYTSNLLGFEDLNWNAVYAQMSRGKTERSIAYALGNLASTIGKMASDICLYINQNFGFFTLPDDFTTGSSIMPHKKNPDIFEIIRAKCNLIQTLPYQINSITANLPSGYFRDLQLIKEIYIPVFDEMTEIIKAMHIGTSKLQIRKEILENPLYDCIFTVEKVNEYVLQGNAFRDAYILVAKEVEDGTFKRDKEIHHTHEGSMGNLCNHKIKERFDDIFGRFDFVRVKQIEKRLLRFE